MSLLSKGSGVAIGAYVGFQAAANLTPLYLYATIPGGIFICCTVAGIAEALQFGLRERLFRWLNPSSAPDAHLQLPELSSEGREERDDRAAKDRNTHVLPWQRKR
jgi:hypothetical protein